MTRAWNRMFICLLIGIFGIFALSSISFGDGDNRNATVIKGHYLGERFPGSQLLLFSDTVVSSLFDEHSGPVFSRDGHEVYWSTYFGDENTGVILHMKMGKDRRWTLPENASFSKEEYCDLNPFLSPNGKTLYFTSRRPVTKPVNDSKESKAKPGEINAWKLQRTDDGWSEPEPVKELLNYGGLDAQVSVCRKGSLYFAAKWPGGNGKYDLYTCTYKNGKYTSPHAIPGSINTEHSEFAAYVDPEERFILFASDRPGGHGGSDIYISRRKGNSWGKPKNLGKAVNTDENETYTSISPDNRYLFVIAQRDDEYNVHWISTRILR